MFFFGRPNIKKLQARRDLNGLYKVALEAKEPSWRAEAVRALGEIGTRDVMEAIERAVDDHSPEVQQATAEALGLILRKGEHGLCQQVVSALGQFRSKRGAAPLAVPLLVEALKHKTPQLRLAALNELAKIHPAHSMEALCLALKDEAIVVRRTAAEALGRKRDTRAVAPLLELLKDGDSDVRKTAAHALSTLGWQPVDNSMRAWHAIAAQQWEEVVRCGTEAVDALMWMLRGSAGQISDRAAASLHKLKAVEPLIAVLTNSGEAPGSQRTAAVVLGRIEDERALGPLLDALRNPDAGVRAAAALASGRIGDERALGPLLDALKDPNADVRAAAAASLASERIGDERALGPLLDALKDRDCDVREAAAKSLSLFGWQPVDSSQRAWRAIARPEPDWEVLRQCGPEAVEPLLTLLDDNNERLAAEMLGEMKATQAVEALVAKLRHGDVWVRCAAAKALGQIGDGRGPDALAELLRDSDTHVREAAAQSLDSLNWRPADDSGRAWCAVALRNWNEASQFGIAALEPLAMVVESDCFCDMRVDAVRALGCIRDARVVAFLTKFHAKVSAERGGFDPVPEYRGQFSYDDYGDIIEKDRVRAANLDKLIFALERALHGFAR
jgi:HEAT repeat protein